MEDLLELISDNTKKAINEIGDEIFQYTYDMLKKHYEITSNLSVSLNSVDLLIWSQVFEVFPKDIVMASNKINNSEIICAYTQRDIEKGARRVTQATASVMSYFNEKFKIIHPVDLSKTKLETLENFSSFRDVKEVICFTMDFSFSEQTLSTLIFIPLRDFEKEI